MNNNTDCQYHHAAPLRLELADALDSGRYQQIPREDRLDCLLRDSQDRHSITGVATAELTPSVWIKAGDAWTVHHLENLIKAFPKVTQFPKEFPNPDHDFLQRIEHLSPKETVHGCPEATACALGIHDNDSDNPSHHPELLWFRANIITPEQKTAASIPRDWHIPYLLDALDFRLAAELLQEYPDLLIGHCTCTVPPSKQTGH